MDKRINDGFRLLTVILLACVTNVAFAASAKQFQTLVDTAYAKYKDVKEGANADYIPILATIPSELFGVVIATRDMPAQFRFVNDLGSAATTNVLAWVAGMDQTLHWADPLNGEMNFCAHAAQPGEPPMGTCAQHYAGPIPSTVHTRRPASIGRSTRQLLIARSFGPPGASGSRHTTVQAPQSPSAQPSLVPQSRRSARRYCSRVVSGPWPARETRFPFSSKSTRSPGPVPPL